MYSCLSFPVAVVSYFGRGNKGIKDIIWLTAASYSPSGQTSRPQKLQTASHTVRKHRDAGRCPAPFLHSLVGNPAMEWYCQQWAGLPPQLTQSRQATGVILDVILESMKLTVPIDYHILLTTQNYRNMAEPILCVTLPLWLPVSQFITIHISLFTYLLTQPSRNPLSS